MGLLQSIPIPFLGDLLPVSYVFFANFSTILIVFGLIFYARLSFIIAVGMLLFCGVCLAGFYAISSTGLSVFWTSLVVFIVAWIGQFYGHNIEGKKPSFIKDLQFLLIGPAWVMGFALRKIGVNY